MKIYNSKNQKILDVVVSDESYRYLEIMGDRSVVLHYSLAEHVELPLGAYVLHEGKAYTLLRSAEFVMHHSRNFEYTVTFHDDFGKAELWKFRNTVDGRLRFTLTATPREHLQMWVDNMNRRDEGWAVGGCIDGEAKTVSYDSFYCSDALNAIASAFGTEHITEGRTVYLGKVERNRDNPLALAYGKGKGFKPDTGRVNDGDRPPVEIVYPEGGERNIDRSVYGSPTLILPAGGVIGYDGARFSDETGYDPSRGRRYVVENDRLSIRRADRSLSSMVEDSLDCTDIFPTVTHIVRRVIEVDRDEHWYDIVLDKESCPESLDYSQLGIVGETPTMIFQNGMLAGREFDFETDDDGNIVCEKIFENEVFVGWKFNIKPEEMDGIIMPDPQSGFMPVADETTLKVFGVRLPNEYICDSENKAGAEWDMFRETVKYMYEHEDALFTFTGTLDDVWSRGVWDGISDRIVLGGYIHFHDPRYCPEGALIRITAIKDYITRPHAPEITLSNGVITPGFKSMTMTRDAEKVIQEERTRGSVQYTKRRFRDAKETMDMLEGAMLEGFTSRISPISVQTMQMLVGDESLQFRFVDSIDNPQEVIHAFVYDQESRRMSSDAAILQHLTIGIDGLSSKHKASDYRYWNIEAYLSPALEDPSKKYYLYAKCSKIQDSGSIVMSETPVSMEGVEGYYHFLIGVLNSELDGERSFAQLYGFTEILPGRITTDKVVSGNGRSYFDLLAEAFKLGDRLKFNVGGGNELLLNGVMVQSTGGDTSLIPCYRGPYDPDVVYYEGDEVSYVDDEGNVSTYTYKNPTPASGVPPTDADYWRPSALGVKGDSQATFKSTAFRRSSTRPDTPQGGSYESPLPTDAGWSDGVPSGDEQLWMSTRVFTSNGKAPQQDSWTVPQPVTDTADIDFEFSDVAINPGTPTTKPANWHNAATEDDIWMAVRKCRNGIWGSWEITKIKGEKGDEGPTGRYTEYRFAKNGSTVAAPDLTVTDAVPYGWSTAQPTLNAGEYMWFTMAIKSGDGTLIQNWSVPKRFTPVDGVNGTSVIAQFSSDRTNWHSTFQTGDLWMRTSSNGGSTWTSAMRIVGEKGDDGDKAPYMDFSFGISAYSTSSGNTTAPSDITSWKDAPPATTTAKPYLWMRSVHYNVNAANEWVAGTAYYSRITGNSGTSVAQVVNEYARNDSADTAPASGWSTTPIAPTITAKYLWGREVTKDENGNVISTSTAHIVANFALPGQDGGTTEVIFKAAGTQPATPSGDSPAGWSTAMPSVSTGLSISRSGDFVIQSDGYLGSGTTADNGAKVDILTISGQKAGDTLVINAFCDSEASYDFMCVGKLDVSADSLATASNCAIRLSGLNQSGSYTFTFSDANVHTIAVKYYKDGSQSRGSDKGWYEWAGGGAAIWASTRVVKGDTKTGWSTPARLSGENGKNGLAGKGITSITEYYLTTSASSGVTRSTSGWSTTPTRTDSTNKYIWNYEDILWSDGTHTYVEPFICGVQGADGVGKPGPAAPYIGAYNASFTYYGTDVRTDVVKYNGRYYVARTDAGEFSNKLPTNTAYWNPFGASYESIATGLLLAENANIAGWIFRNNRLESQESDIFLDGLNDRIGFGSGMLIDGTDFVQLRDSQGRILTQIAPDTISNLITKAGISRSTVSDTSGYISDSVSAGRTSSGQFQMATLTLGSITSGKTLAVGDFTMDPSYFPAGDREDNYLALGITVTARIRRNGTVVSTKRMTFYFYSDSSADAQSYSINESFTTAGTYTLTLEGEYVLDGTDSSYSRSVNLYFRYDSRVSVQVSSRIIVGTDGMWLFKDMNHYLQMTHDSGFEIVQGLYGLRVTSSGVSKSYNGGNTWMLI